MEDIGRRQRQFIHRRSQFLYHHKKIELEHPPGSYKVLVVVSVIHIADHHPRYAGMDELVIAEINPHMRDSPPFAQRMEKDQVPLLQLVPVDMMACLILLL